MKGTNGILIHGLTLTLILLGLSLWPSAAYAQWTRLPMQEGGVPEDIQLLRRANNAFGDTVWSANMETGLFRATWSPNQSTWSSWSEHLPGRGILGVDAIRTDSEYVLAATGSWGLYYEANPTPSGSTSDWHRPNGDLAYPDAWDTAMTHDAAFYCDTSGSYPSNPQTQYFAILFVGLSTTNQNAGIYRWTGTSPNYFSRVDKAHDYDDPRSFMHFWRDLGDPNVLYVTAEDGIYKLWGEYRHPRFEKLPPQTKLEDLPIAWPPADLPPLPAMPQVDRAPACMMGRIER